MIAEIEHAAFQSCGMRTPIADLNALSFLAGAATHRPHATRVLVEIGTWAGRTALALLEKCPPDTLLFCVDTWEGTPGDVTRELVSRFGAPRIFKAFTRNMGERLYNTVFPLIGSSLDWAQRFYRKADLVFIDACHEYDAVKADIAAWTPHVAPGGILCGHDMGEPGVAAAINEGPGFKKAGKCVWWRQV